MDERSQFTFYRSYWEAIQMLPKKERLAVYEAISAYALNGSAPALSGAAATVFILVKPTLDTGRRKAEIGKKGGSKAKANGKQDGSKAEAKPKQNESNEKANGKQTESEKENEIEVEIEIEKELEIEKDSLKKSKPKESGSATPSVSTPRFVPPTVEEVGAYCRERGNGIDPQTFVDYYETRNWYVGKTKMKDWKAAIRTWENRRREDERAKQGGFKYDDRVEEGWSL